MATMTRNRAGNQLEIALLLNYSTLIASSAVSLLLHFILYQVSGIFRTSNNLPEGLC